jgi:hypothetical protein
MRYARWAFLIMATALIGGLAIRQARVYHGYCPSSGLTLSDQERIRLAVQYELHTFRFASPTYNPAYESVDAFLKAFPGCCTIVDGAPEVASPTFYERLTGTTYRIVAIRRQAAADDDAEADKALGMRFVPMSACGKGHSLLD